MASVPTSVPGFVGASNRLRSPAADPSDVIDWYIERTAPGAGTKAQSYYAPTPGLTPYAAVDDAPGRCMWYQDGRFFGITGGTFYELFQNQTVLVRGSVGNISNQSSIVSNGTAGDQLLICDGFDGYVFTLSTNAFTMINNTTFPGTGFPFGQALCVEFIDGYGVVVQRQSRVFFISAVEDFTSWDPLDFAERSEGSDNLAAVRRNGRELWFPGSLTGEVWTDIGDPLFPFAPIPGVFMESGCTGAQGFPRFGGSLAWVQSDEHGAGVVVMANGYQGQRISTHAVEKDLQSVTDLTFSFLFAQQQQGHNFLWVLFPELHWTWVYDLTVGLWHKRAIWNAKTALYEPHPARCHAYAWGDRVNAVHLIGDRLSGTIYQLNLNAYSDEIAP